MWGARWHRRAALALALLAGAGAALEQCSCDCCEVEVQRDELESRFECALAEPGTTSTSPFRAQRAQCGSLCQQNGRDNILTASEVPEVDSQRFCYFECEPRPLSSRSPQSGDMCRPLAKKDRRAVRDKSGNAVPPNEAPELAAHFLARRSAAATAGAAAGQAAAAAWARKRRAAAAAVARRHARAGGAVEPWSTVGESAQEESARVADMALEAERHEKSVAESAKEVKGLAAKAIAAVPVASAAVEAAKLASLQAFQAEEGVRNMRDDVLKAARSEAAEVVQDTLKEMKAEARAEAKTEAIKKAKALKAKMLEEAPAAGAAAALPYVEAMKRAGAAAAAWQKSADGLTAKSASVQAEASALFGQANQFNAVGDAASAQKVMQQANMMMNMAVGLNSKANSFYGTAKGITDSLPLYGPEAAAASYHAEVMLNPDLPPPSPPIV